MGRKMSCSGVGLQGTGRVRTLPEPKGTAATYVSVLVRAHLRQLAPLPDRELSALRSTVNELAALGRNLNTMARLLQQDSRAVVPGRNEVLSMVKICEVLRDPLSRSHQGESRELGGRTYREGSLGLARRFRCSTSGASPVGGPMDGYTCRRLSSSR
jgi:hypothetical protein